MTQDITQKKEAFLKQCVIHLIFFCLSQVFINLYIGNSLNVFIFNCYLAAVLVIYFLNIPFKTKFFVWNVFIFFMFCFFYVQYYKTLPVLNIMFFPFLLFVFASFSWRTTCICALIVIFVIISTPYFAAIFHIPSAQINCSKTVRNIIILSLICKDILNCIIILRFINDNKQKKNTFENNKPLPIVTNILSNNYKEKDFENDAFFEKIIAFINDEKPFLNPHYKLFHLATSLKTSPSKVSKSIFKNTNYNFKNFINKYRIEQVKTDLGTDLNKFTIQHIYKSAGFEHQATFNRIFKDFEGISPKEYIAKLKNNTS